MSDFNPNAPSAQNCLFGLNESKEGAAIHIHSVPWDATTSYRSGTSRGPEAILKASEQLDLYDRELEKIYESGIYFFKPNSELVALNDKTKKQVEDFRNTNKGLELINKNCDQMNTFVYKHIKESLSAEKCVGVLGGDHSVPLGAIRAFTEKYGSDFGILHIDAHMDLRDAYEGFTWSHASIFRNILNEEKSPAHVVQVGIRDFCEEEFHFAQEHGGRVHVFFDHDIKVQLSKGAYWFDMAQSIVKSLPKKVYISFDIDGLDPVFCPNTGTPVPGGLDYDQALILLSVLGNSGRQIIGFDLCEVAPSPHDPNDEWDGNVGMRLLYKLCGWLAKTNGFL